MKYLFLVLIIFCSLYSHGQKLTFKLGEEFLVPWSANDLSFFGNEDGIVNLYLNQKKLTIVRFDPVTLAHSSEKVITLDKATKHFNSEILVEFDKKFFWLHSDWDRQAEKEILYADKIDVEAGSIAETGDQIIRASKIAGLFDPFFTGSQVVNKYNFDFDVAHKKLLVTYRLQPETRNDKNNYDKFGFYVFDENMNKLWSNEFTMPYTEAIMDNSDFCLNSAGDAFLLAKIYDSEKRKERDKETGLPAYHFEVLKFTKNNKKVTIAPVTIDSTFILEATLMESVLHDMIIACTYSKKSKGKSTDGIFLAKLDSNNKISKYKTGLCEFPLEELAKFETEKNKRKMEDAKNYENPNLRVRDVIVEGDGSIFISCEEYYMRNAARSYGSDKNSYTWHYEDIIAVKINPAGELQWLRKIPKRQKSSSLEGYYPQGNPYHGTMGFKLINNANGYYFLYLDNKKNNELKEQDVPITYMDDYGGQLVVSKIDTKGILTKELLFDIKEENLRLYPFEFKKINNNQFIGRAKLKKFLAHKPMLINVD